MTSPLGNLTSGAILIAFGVWRLRHAWGAEGRSDGEMWRRLRHAQGVFSLALGVLAAGSAFWV